MNDLLDLAKAESGRLEPEYSQVELGEIFSELRGSLRPLVRPEVYLDIVLDGVSTIETDRKLLVQVLRNLLTNALKFTKSGSVKLLAQKTQSAHIRITIEDTGIGIAPEDQARVFEEFYQVRGPLQIDHKGTGLGLPYARRVTNVLGGEMRLESEVGRRTTFMLCLPIAPEPHLLVKHIQEITEYLHGKVQTILIIDDDEAFQGTSSEVSSKVLPFVLLKHLVESKD